MPTFPTCRRRLPAPLEARGVAPPIHPSTHKSKDHPTTHHHPPPTCNCHLRGDHFGCGAFVGMSIACMSFVPANAGGWGVVLCCKGGWPKGGRVAGGGWRWCLCAVHLATCQGCSTRNKMAANCTANIPMKNDFFLNSKIILIQKINIRA